MLHESSSSGNNNNCWWCHSPAWHLFMSLFLCLFIWLFDCAWVCVCHAYFLFQGKNCWHFYWFFPPSFSFFVVCRPQKDSLGVGERGRGKASWLRRARHATNAANKWHHYGNNNNNNKNKRRHRTLSLILLKKWTHFFRLLFDILLYFKAKNKHKREQEKSI